MERFVEGEAVEARAPVRADDGHHHERQNHCADAQFTGVNPNDGDLDLVITNRDLFPPLLIRRTPS